jgi:hypothetical protein
MGNEGAEPVSVELTPAVGHAERLRILAEWGQVKDHRPACLAGATAIDEVATLRAALENAQDETWAGAVTYVRDMAKTIRALTQRFVADGAIAELATVRAEALEECADGMERAAKKARATPTIKHAQKVWPTPAPGREMKPPAEYVIEPHVESCERCQMKLPEHLGAYGIGVRGGTAWRCAACQPIEGPSGRLFREEVVRRRKQYLAAASGGNPE